jgi:single-stranded DNA-binding protein
MAYELSGKIKVIQAAQVLGAKGFTKREFVVTVEDGKYPQEIALECVQDKVKLLDGVKEGQTVTVTFDIRGREYNGRYFVNLQAWRIKADTEGQSAGGDDRDPLPNDSEAPDNLDDDEIPF